MTESEAREIARLYPNTSAEDIADLFGIYPYRVKLIAEDNGPMWRKRECIVCGSGFLAKRDRTVMCSRKCQGTYAARKLNGASEMAQLRSKPEIMNFPEGRLVTMMAQLPPVERRKACLGWPEFAATEGLRRGWVSRDDLREVAA